MNVVITLIIVFSYCQIERPIIGIMTQPVSCNPDLVSTDEHYSFINSDYVKWLEMSGAKVIPILFDWPRSKHEYFFERINGIMFPGGDCPLRFGSSFMDTQEFYFNKSLSDSYFPIWGTCQGFEDLFILAAGTDTVLNRNVSASQVNRALILNDKVKSRIFQNASQHLMDILTTQKVTFNWHSWGILPTTIQNTPSLSSFYDIVSTNFDIYGKEFVSTIQAKNYPIYGAQWHAEMPLFATLPKQITHYYDSVIANQVTTTFFVNECRKSKHKFLEENNEYSDDFSIENFSPVFTGKRGGNSIRQCYYFSNQNSDHNDKKKKKKNPLSDKLQYEYIIIGLSCGMFCCCCLFCVVCFVCFMDLVVKIIRRVFKKKIIGRDEEESLNRNDEDIDEEQRRYEDFSFFSDPPKPSDFVGDGNDIVTSEGMLSTNQSGVNYQTETIVNSIFDD